MANRKSKLPMLPLAKERETYTPGPAIVYGTACQDRYCKPPGTRALPGKDYCAKHQAMFEADQSSVRPYGKIRIDGLLRPFDYMPSRSREPGDDDEPIPADANQP